MTNPCPHNQTDEQTFLRLYHKSLRGESLTIQERYQATMSLTRALMACHDPVAKQVAKFTESREDAEDMVSEAIEKLYKIALGQIGLTSDINSTNTFVTSVLSAIKALIGAPFYGETKGLLASYVRRRKTAQNLQEASVEHLKGTLAEISVSEDNPLSSALSQLPDLEYEALKAKFLSPESDDDICRAFNLEKEELRTISRKGNNLLKQELESQGIMSFAPSFF